MSETTLLAAYSLRRSDRETVYFERVYPQDDGHTLPRFFPLRQDVWRLLDCPHKFKLTLEGMYGDVNELNTRAQRELRGEYAN